MDQQDVPATKAWRPTSVVGERDRPKTLSSRRSHRKKKNRRGSGILNRRKVKLIRKHNRKWRWRNKWRIKLLKVQKKALSPAPELPGMNIPNNGQPSTEHEAWKDVESGNLSLDLTADTKNSDGGHSLEDNQQGTRSVTSTRDPPRRDTDGKNKSVHPSTRVSSTTPAEGRINSSDTKIQHKMGAMRPNTTSLLQPDSRMVKTNRSAPVPLEHGR